VPSPAGHGAISVVFRTVLSTDVICRFFSVVQSLFSFVVSISSRRQVALRTAMVVWTAYG
jgi:hypothetical protein